MSINKTELLETAHAARLDEVTMHQINIDNYRLAIIEIDQNHGSEMKPFRDQLEGLLNSSIFEQTKEKIMVKVLAKQLGK